MIVGTAGHIDHGKTALVKALTGVDADRLKEEKARGITIDLGYAYSDLGDGRQLGFVDVPGHERFVHNMLAGATGKRRDPAQTQSLFALAGDAKQPAPIRVALLNGIALGLQGQGGGGGGGPVAGGRAGPGVAGVNNNRNGGPSLFQLAAEPKSITTLAASPGPASAAAKQVVALVTWPGKPPPPAVAPRTPAEEKLFQAGKAIYASTCAACHQPEGQGLEHIGAKLAGSRFVNMPGDATVRILVNGKEGAIGAMPPLGQALSDDDLAGVLTYIRGSFGNTSPPIVPALVKETRAAYAHRTTPWTEQELTPRR
jgi:mono/diheme cytochrome c family protein